MRRGESSDMPGTSSQPYDVQPGPSAVLEVQNSEEDNDETTNKKDIETANVNLGREFIEHSDNIFNRKTIYSKNIVPMVNMPVSISNQINALWLESYAYQLHSQAAYLEILISEDRELTRQLAEKEAELAREGKEPKMLDFKEIMDMDLAMSIYKKDIREWKNNNEPNNIAAKMNRDKLFNLFPELSSETLAEVLMAHENNFLATVEPLDGLPEWPVMPFTGEVSLSAANRYRDVAKQYFDLKNLALQKAQELSRRGMGKRAARQWGLARSHRLQFELANMLAASIFMECHAAKHNEITLDLHYLFVSEAVQALDVFLDHHIQTLRERAKHFEDPNPTVSVYLIPGRGLHSKGEPKLKPATIERLKERNLTWSERNPGLLCVPLTADNVLSCQVL